MSYEVMLNIDGPRDREYVLEVGEAVAEGLRVLNHVTRDQDALRYPADADRLIRYLATAASRLPQLLEQVDHWLQAEHQAGRVTVDGGTLKGHPGIAAAAVSDRLQEAARVTARLHAELDAAATVTSEMGSTRESGDDDD